jgi:transposase-like protein
MCEFASLRSVVMRIDCPHCEQAMLVKVGLSPDTKNNSIRCISCNSEMVASVPGPVIGTPRKAEVGKQPTANSSDGPSTLL